MADQNSGPAPPAAQAQPPATQAHARAAQAHALAAHAHALTAQTEVLAAQAQPPLTQAQAQALATQVHSLAAQARALAAQAEVLAAQAQPPAAQAQPPVTQAQALATQARALAVHAEVLAAQAQPPVTQAQVQALATQAHALAAQAQVLAAQPLVTPNYDVEAAEKNVLSYQEIAHLQDINLRYPIHKLALEDWERREKYLSNKISRREGQSNDLTNQIYSIFGFFAVFQGVLLTAVMQLKQTAHPELGGVPVCGKIWFPIVLTVFATAATLVAIADKFRSLQSLKLVIRTETQPKNEVAQRVKDLRREGPEKFKFHIHAGDSRHLTHKKLVKKRNLVIASLLIFMGICILSYFVILCDLWVVRKLDKGFSKLKN